MTQRPTSNNTNVFFKVLQIVLNGAPDPDDD